MRSRRLHSLLFCTGSRWGPLHLAVTATCRRLWFLLASWTGSETVRDSFKARGFLLGTSQVR